MKGRLAKLIGGRPSPGPRKGARRLARSLYDGRIVTASAAPPFRPPLALETHDTTQDPEEAARSLRSAGNRRDRLHVVLPWDAYQLFLLDRPEVPPAEIRGALRWKIRELIDYHPDDATLDAFEVPVETRAGSPRMIYVVTAPTARLRSVIDSVAASPAPLAVLDIPELCLRNLVASHPAETGTVAVYCEAEQGCLILCRGPTLYLTRRLDFGHGLRARDGDPAFADRIALEIQRSLDYVDRHYRLPLPRNVLLLPLPGPDGGLARAVGEKLGVGCATFSLETLLAPRPDRPGGGGEDPALCLAVGALLREDGAA